MTLHFVCLLASVSLCVSIYLKSGVENAAKIDFLCMKVMVSKKQDTIDQVG